MRKRKKEKLLASVRGGGAAARLRIEMAVAVKEASTVVTSTGKEGKLVKRGDMAMVIELVGNAVFMLEFMLLVWFAIKTVILFPGWEGVLLDVFISPAAIIMVLVLTRLLKKDFVGRYREGYDAGVNQSSVK